jgi:CRISPR-associated exonuclease Cas4
LNNYSEQVLISALEHWSYCPRQCALIHLESVWDENLYTLRGAAAHTRADAAADRDEAGLRVVRAMPLWSDRLGLYGQADVVEFHGETPYPVEYKSGSRRDWRHEALQLCAQALCLEEMLGRTVDEGAVYYQSTHRRRVIRIDAELRGATERAVTGVRQMLAGARLPPAVNDERCPNCSLLESCLPAIVSNNHRIGAFRAALFTPLPEPAEGG